MAKIDQNGKGLAFTFCSFFKHLLNLIHTSWVTVSHLGLLCRILGYCVVEAGNPRRLKVKFTGEYSPEFLPGLYNILYVALMLYNVLVRHTTVACSALSVLPA